MYCAIGELLSIYIIPRANEYTRVYTFRGVEVLYYALAVPLLLLLLRIILNVYWLYLFSCKVLVVLFRCSVVHMLRQRLCQPKFNLLLVKAFSLH